MLKPAQKAVLATAIGFALVGGSCAPVFAADAATADQLTRIHAAGAAAVTSRISLLNATVKKVSGITRISVADKATVVGTLNGEIAALASLGGTLAADTDVTSAIRDAHAIDTTVRVRAVAVPEAWFATAAYGFSDDTLPRLSKLSAEIVTALPAKPSADIQEKVDDMNSRIGAAIAANNGIAAAVMDITPSAWNANHKIFAPLRTKLETVRLATKTAIADAVAIRASLK